MGKIIRVLVAKAGCDIHERGALTMINAFRDAGMEVIYTGRYQSEGTIVRTAIAEDVDVIGVSDLTGGLPIICRNILEGLRKQEYDIPLFCGGLLTPSDKKELLTMGVRACYPTGSSIEDCVKDVRQMAGQNG